MPKFEPGSNGLLRAGGGAQWIFSRRKKSTLWAVGKRVSMQVAGRSIQSGRSIRARFLQSICELTSLPCCPHHSARQHARSGSRWPHCGADVCIAVLPGGLPNLSRTRHRKWITPRGRPRAVKHGVEGLVLWKPRTPQIDRCSDAACEPALCTAALQYRAPHQSIRELGKTEISTPHHGKKLRHLHPPQTIRIHRECALEHGRTPCKASAALTRAYAADVDLLPEDLPPRQTDGL